MVISICWPDEVVITCVCTTMFVAPSLAARACCNLGRLLSFSMSLGDLPNEFRFCCFVGCPARLDLLLLLPAPLGAEGVATTLAAAECGSGLEQTRCALEDEEAELSVCLKALDESRDAAMTEAEAACSQLLPETLAPLLLLLLLNEAMCCLCPIVGWLPPLLKVVATNALLFSPFKLK